MVYHITCCDDRQGVTFEANEDQKDILTILGHSPDFFDVLPQIHGPMTTHYHITRCQWGSPVSRIVLRGE